MRLQPKTALFAALVVAAMGTTSVAHADFIDHFSKPADVGAAKVPSMGTSQVLVITVEVAGYEPLDMEAIRAYFAETPSGESQFTDFYDRASLGLFHPVVTVLDPVQYDACPLPEDYFGYEDCSIPRGGGGDVAMIVDSVEAGLALITDILTRVDTEQEVDFSRFDVNGPDGSPDGWIDGVLLLHNIGFGGIALPIYTLTEVPEFDGTQVNIVGIAESEHVALHEFGHLLGWADLYDETGVTRGYQYSHMGSWGYSTPPPAPDGFSRMVAGWVTPRVFSEGDSETDVRIEPAIGGDVVQVGTGTEYYLLENRGAVDGDYIDAGIRGRGLSITHVNLDEYPDDSSGQWPIRLLNCLNCEPWAPMLMNEQADGEFHFQRGEQRKDLDDLFLAGDSFVPVINHEPLSGSNRVLSSNYYDGRSSGISISNVRIEGDDIVVDITVEEPCAALECTDGTCSDGVCVLPEPEPEPEPENNGAPMFEPDPTSDDDGDDCSVAPGTSNSSVVLLLAIGLVFGGLRRRSR